jgi:hypothetical protein
LLQAAERALAVADALTWLGEQADPARVAEEVKARQGIDLRPEEVEATRAALLESFTTSDRVVRRCGRFTLFRGRSGFWWDLTSRAGSHWYWHPESRQWLGDRRCYPTLEAATAGLGWTLAHESAGDLNEQAVPEHPARRFPAEVQHEPVARDQPARRGPAPVPRTGGGGGRGERAL